MFALHVKSDRFCWIFRKNELHLQRDCDLSDFFSHQTLKKNYFNLSFTPLYQNALRFSSHRHMGHTLTNSQNKRWNRWYEIPPQSFDPFDRTKNIVHTYTHTDNKRKRKNPKSKKNKGAAPSLCNQKRNRRRCVKNLSLQNQILFFWYYFSDASTAQILLWLRLYLPYAVVCVCVRVPADMVIVFWSLITFRFPFKTHYLP